VLPVQMTLSPDTQKWLLIAIAIGVGLLIVIQVVRRVRLARDRKPPVSRAPVPQFREVTPEEWVADFDRTVSELLGVDAAADDGEIRVDGFMANGRASSNGGHSHVDNGGLPVRGNGVPFPAPLDRRAGIAPSRHAYDPAPMTAVDPYGADATLQLLPGRLEAISGFPGREIRFVHRPGLTRFTFGRSPGPSFEHVQIRAPTVSRMHAFMEYVYGEWRIGNLSATNAVLVNGTPVVGGNTVPLREGDYVEMGEVVFVFRER